MKIPFRLVGALLFLAGFEVTARGAELAWVELMTSGGPAEAASFYEKTFGWTGERTGGGDWDAVVLHRGGRPVAVVVHRQGERMAKARSKWVGFFGVAELEAAGAAAAGAGGRVLEEGHAGAAAGARVSLLADREGAVFGVLAPQAGAKRPEAARGFWAVVLARETPAAAKFYREVLGGEIRPEGRTPLFAGDFLLTGPTGAWAGVQPAGVSGRAGWLILIGVADIDATVKAARREGARVLREPKVDLIGGRVAVLSDPTGGVFGLYEAIAVAPRSGRSGAVSAGDFEVEALSR